MLSAVTEKLLTALSLWWVPISIILVLETLIVKKLDPFQLTNLSRSDESLDSISLTELPAKKSKRIIGVELYATCSYSKWQIIDIHYE